MSNKLLCEKIILDPIGTVITLSRDDINYLYPSSGHPVKVELYCPYCKEKRVFKCKDSNGIGGYINYKSDAEYAIFKHSNELIVYDFSCEYDHNLKIAFETLSNGNMVKFGQYPSPMLFSKSINDEIFKILDDNEKEYYLLSIKSRANNLNIASFLYLRRVFESLIDKVKNGSKTDFSGMKTKEVIKQLIKEGMLNEMLKDNGYNVLYSLLSDGVHNLSEKECESMFDLLKSAIEIILEDEIYKKNLNRRKLEIGNLLSNKNSENKS